MPRRIRVKPDYKSTPIPNRLGELRANIPMARVAKSLGISLGTYGGYESGHLLPSKPVLEILCGFNRCKDIDIYDEAICRIINTYYDDNKASWDDEP